MLVKQLKNRYNDVTVNRKFIIGVDRARMKLFDIEQQAQNLIQAEQNMSNTTVKRRKKVRRKNTRSLKLQVLSIL